LEVEFRHDCRMVGGGVGLVRYHAQTPGHFVHAPALDGNRPQRLPQRLEHQQIVDLVLLVTVKIGIALRLRQSTRDIMQPRQAKQWAQCIPGSVDLVPGHHDEILAEIKIPAQNRGQAFRLTLAPDVAFGLVAEGLALEMIR